MLLKKKNAIPTNPDVEFYDTCIKQSLSHPSWVTA